MFSLTILLLHQNTSLLGYLSHYNILKHNCCSCHRSTMDEKWLSLDFDLLSDSAECMSIKCEQAILYYGLFRAFDKLYEDICCKTITLVQKGLNSISKCDQKWCSMLTITVLYNNVGDKREMQISKTLLLDDKRIVFE